MSKRWAAAAALLLAILLIWWWRRSPETPKVTTTTSSAEAEDRAPAAPNHPPSRPVPRPLAAVAAPPLPPIIDEISLEKTEVCEGEENLVSIRAHTPENQEDQYLHYAIGGETGAHIPIIGTRNAAVMSAYRVSVFGRNNVATTAELPHFTVKQCKAPHRLIIEHRVNPNTEAEFSFSAMLRDPPGAAPLKPIRYLWDFGDGTSTETTVPLAEHDYTARPQNTLYAQLLIRCTAIDAAGEQVIGRDALQLINPDWETLAYKGVVRLHFTLTPRFPTLDESGVVTQKVRIWHNAAEPVEIDRVELLRVVENSDAPPGEEVGVQRFLGTNRIPPAGIEIVASFDTKAESNVLSHTWALSGWSADGFPVRGELSVLKPTALPTRENSNPVVDPMLRAKIMKAREILGKAYVTDEDLWRLDREGAFANLAPLPMAGPPPTAPTPPKPILDEETEEQARRRNTGKPPPVPSAPPATPSESLPGR